MNRKFFPCILAFCAIFVNLLFLNIQEIRKPMEAPSNRLLCPTTPSLSHPNQPSARRSLGESGDPPGNPPPLSRYEFQHPQMGTLFTIVLYAEDSLHALAAARAAFTRIDSLNAMLSDYLEDSELSRLSARAGEEGWIPVSVEMWFILKRSQEVSALSCGAFDPTIGPLSRLWRKAFRQGAFPDTAALRIAREKVGYRHLQFHHTQQLVRLRRPGMRLDLGGIAKGYAVDAAMAVLRECSIPAALVDGGGDLLAGDPPPDKAGWRVAIGKDTVLTISRQAVATSGDSYRYLEWQGRRYSHIIDPRTGLGVSHGRQVTIMATDCTTADALASALSVEPALKNRIKRIFPGAEAIIRE